MSGNKKISIRERIRAMNTQLDLVDHEQPNSNVIRLLGFSDSESSVSEIRDSRKLVTTWSSSSSSKHVETQDDDSTVAASSSVTSNAIQKQQHTSRSSVIEIWRQREGKPPLKNANDPVTPDLEPRIPQSQGTLTKYQEKQQQRQQIYLGGEFHRSFDSSSDGEEKKEVDYEDRENFRGQERHYSARAELEKFSTSQTIVNQLSQMSTVSHDPDTVPPSLQGSADEGSGSEFAELLVKFSRQKTLRQKKQSQTEPVSNTVQVKSLHNDENVDEKPPAVAQQWNTPVTPKSSNLNSTTSSYKKDAPSPVKSILKNNVEARWIKPSSDILTENTRLRKVGGAVEEPKKKIDVAADELRSGNTLCRGNPRQTETIKNSDMTPDQEKQDVVSRLLTTESLRHGMDVKATIHSEEQGFTSTTEGLVADSDSRKLNLIRASIDSYGSTQIVDIQNDRKTVTSNWNRDRIGVSLPVAIKKEVGNVNADGHSITSQKVACDSNNGSYTEEHLSIPKPDKSVFERWKGLEVKANVVSPRETTWYSRKTYSPKVSGKHGGGDIPQDEASVISSVNSKTKDGATSSEHSRSSYAAVNQSNPISSDASTGDSISSDRKSIKEFWSTKEKESIASSSTKDSISKGSVVKKDTNDNNANKRNVARRVVDAIPIMTHSPRLPRGPAPQKKHNGETGKDRDYLKQHFDSPRESPRQVQLDRTYNSDSSSVIEKVNKERDDRQPQQNLTPNRMGKQNSNTFLQANVDKGSKIDNNSRSPMIPVRDRKFDENGIEDTSSSSTTETSDVENKNEYFNQNSDVYTSKTELYSGEAIESAASVICAPQAQSMQSETKPDAPAEDITHPFQAWTTKRSPWLSKSDVDDIQIKKRNEMNLAMNIITPLKGVSMKSTKENTDVAILQSNRTMESAVGQTPRSRTGTDPPTLVLNRWRPLKHDERSYTNTKSQISTEAEKLNGSDAFDRETHTQSMSEADVIASSVEQSLTTAVNKHGRGVVDKTDVGSLTSKCSIAVVASSRHSQDSVEEIASQHPEPSAQNSDNATSQSLQGAFRARSLSPLATRCKAMNDSELVRLAVRSLSPRRTSGEPESGIDQDFIDRRAAALKEWQGQNRGRLEPLGTHESQLVEPVTVRADESAVDSIFSEGNKLVQGPFEVPHEDQPIERTKSVKEVGGNRIRDNPKVETKARPNLFSLSIYSAKLANAVVRNTSVPSTTELKDQKFESKISQPLLAIKSPASKDSHLQLKLAQATIQVPNLNVPKSEFAAVPRMQQTSSSFETNVPSSSSSDASKPSAKKKKNFVMLGKKHLVKQTQNNVSKTSLEKGPKLTTKNNEADNHPSRPLVAGNALSKEQLRSQGDSSGLQYPHVVNNRISKSSNNVNDKLTKSSNQAYLQQSAASLSNGKKIQPSADNSRNIGSRNGRFATEHFRNDSSTAESINRSLKFHTLLPKQKTESAFNKDERNQFQINPSPRLRSRTPQREPQNPSAPILHTHDESGNLLSRSKSRKTVDAKGNTSKSLKTISDGKKHSLSLSKKAAIATTQHALHTRKMNKSTENFDKNNAIEPDGIYYPPQNKADNRGSLPTDRLGNRICRIREQSATFRTQEDENRGPVTETGRNIFHEKQTSSIGYSDMKDGRNDTELVNPNPFHPNGASKNNTGVLPHLRQHKAFGSYPKTPYGDAANSRAEPNPLLFEDNHQTQEIHSAYSYESVMSDSSADRFLKGRMSNLDVPEPATAYDDEEHFTQKSTTSPGFLAGRRFDEILRHIEENKAYLREGNYSDYVGACVTSFEGPMNAYRDVDDSVRYAEGSKTNSRQKSNRKPTGAHLSQRYTTSSRFMDADATTIATSDCASDFIQRSQSTGFIQQSQSSASGESSDVTLENATSETDSIHETKEGKRGIKIQTDGLCHNPAEIISEQFLQEKAANVYQMHNACKNITVRDLADDMVGEVNLVSADLRSFAFGINDKMAALREFVGRTNESGAVSLLPKCQNLVPYDVEDVAIEVEYLAGDATEGAYTYDDPQQDFGICTAHVDQTIDKVDDALGGLRPSINCLESPSKTKKSSARKKKKVTGKKLESS